MGQSLSASILIVCLYFLHEIERLIAKSNGKIPVVGKQALAGSLKDGIACM